MKESMSQRLTREFKPLDVFDRVLVILYDEKGITSLESLNDLHLATHRGIGEFSKGDNTRQQLLIDKFALLFSREHPYSHLLEEFVHWNIGHTLTLDPSKLGRAYIIIPEKLERKKYPEQAEKLARAIADNYQQQN